MRLQRFLSQAGVASRRAAEELIRAGRVRVNGAVVTEMGVQVGAADRVEVDGAPVAAAAPVWIILHKPVGYVTTRDDPQGRATVYDLLPARFHGLFHVGRLDLTSEGLLLLTNEGDVAHRMVHPSYEVDRVYEIEVAGTPSSATLARLVAGVQLEDGPARAHALTVMGGKDAGSRLRIVMREGRKREVRRLLEAVGHPVRRLVRIRLGPIELGDLPPGKWRPLSDTEVAALRRA